MITEFALDLRLARRKSGLSQKEVAYLLSIDQSTYSDFERGEKVPSLKQICQLSLIYGRSFHSYFERINQRGETPTGQTPRDASKDKKPTVADIQSRHNHQPNEGPAQAAK